MVKNVFSYHWHLKNGYPQSIDNSVTKNNYNVFSTFVNGGGSTMGYKLAGFNHLGGVEIDSKTANCYKQNHNPLFLFVEDIRDFNKRKDLPPELYNLDILDGSPPCTTFSLSGKREDAFGVKKVFHEGNKEQTLDDLLFEYANTINKLKPKVFIMENVKGLIIGSGQVYIKKFISLLQDYNIQVFLLNSADMGVPQSRNRVFAIGYKKEFKLPKLNLDFKDKHIPFKDISDDEDTQERISDLYSKYWDIAKYGDSLGKFCSARKVYPNKPCLTLLTRGCYHYKYKRELNTKERLLASSFPMDYAFSGHQPIFYTGMCVPPLMTANISLQIKLQWLDRIK